MDFMDILSGPGNRFDAGLTHGVRETKALRDAIFYIQKKITDLEARMPKTEEKKPGRPKKNEG